MNGIAKSFSRALLLMCVAGLALGTTGGRAHAGLHEELLLAHRLVEESVLKLATTKDRVQRQHLLRSAIEAMGVIAAAPGAESGGEAADVQRALRSQAVDLDGLRLALVEDLSTGDGADAADEARAVLLAITNPAYSTAGWTLLAHLEQERGKAGEAERLVARAIGEAKKIDRAETRDGALRAAVLALKGTQRSLVVEVATDAMSDADAREGTYRVLARLEREGSNGSLEADALLAEVEGAISAGERTAALRLAQALDRKHPRKDALLAQVLDRSIAALDNRTALEAAKTMASNKAQDEALGTIIDAHLQRQRPLRALEVAPLMIKPSARIKATVAIAKELDEQGYATAARETLLEIDPAPLPPDALAKLSVGLADIGAHAQALALAERLPAGPERSFAFSRLAKRLSDDGNVEAADRLLQKVEAEDDRSFARSGIARARAQAGQIDAALAELADLRSGADRDRVLSAVAAASARKGGLNEARTAIEQIQSFDQRVDAKLELANQVDAASALAELEEIQKEAQAANEAEAAVALKDVASAFAERGAFDRADRAATGIADNGEREAAFEANALSALRQGEHEAARERAQHLAEPNRSTLLGELAFAAWQQHENAARLVDDLQPLDFRTRVAILRRMSEKEAAQLDRNGLLQNLKSDPLVVPPAETSRPADFVLGGHRLQAPVSSVTAPEALQIPASLALTAASLRETTPAPIGGEGQVAILGFSPFGLEAFKLTSSGNAAAHQVQVSQNLTWPHYIAIKSGTVTLGQLLRDLPETRKRRFLEPSGDALLIRAPIIVLPGATLLMSGAEFGSYRLSAQSGSFIAVAGNLRIQDTEVLGFDENLNAPAHATEADKAAFRPFITAWGGSNLKIGGSRIAMLGYDSGKAYGLTQSSGAAVQSLYNLGSGRPRGEIVDNSFENLRYGYYSYEADDVALIGNEYRDNIVYGIDPHDRSRRLVIALNTSYGAAKKHGIIVSREVDDSFIIGNVSLRNAGSGLMLDRLSQRNLIYANTSIDNGGDGLTFYESGCNLAAANHLANNARAGIKIRNSTDVTLQ
ncbi:MAG TPA: right-handed parallel beta-helix repeat-containing protein, partial [Tianweitania sediminis]|nr:right-handed parallel beta-helix repeat-containing protein [Tianweitania sediminis]